MARVLRHATHHPHRQHRDDLLAEVRGAWA